MIGLRKDYDRKISRKADFSALPSSARAAKLEIKAEDHNTQDTEDTKTEPNKGY